MLGRRKRRRGEAAQTPTATLTTAEGLRADIPTLCAARKWRKLDRRDLARGEATMSPVTLRRKLLASSVLAAAVGLIWVVPFTPVVAQQTAASPNFSSSQFGW